MLKYILLAAALVAPPALGAPLKAPAAATRPAALAYLIAQGLVVNSRFSTPGDLTGYIGTIPNGKQIVFYVPRDGTVAIFGAMLDAYGHNLSRAYLRQYKQGPAAAASYKALEKLNWIAEGDPHPKRIVYAFLDPNCPYCWQFWKTAQKAYGKGVQVRYVMVAILGKSSLHKAAAILASENPQRALDKNEQGFSHHEGAIAPLFEVPPKLLKEIGDNTALMKRFGFDGTPALVWKTSAGVVKTNNGLPPGNMLAKIFGLAKNREAP